MRPPTRGRPFPGNIIPADRINPVAQNLLAIFPLPTSSGVSNNLLLNVVDSQVQDQFDVRVDQTLSDKDSMFGRYTWGRANIDYPGIPLMINGALNPYAFAQGSATAGSLTVNKAPSMQATLQEVHTFSPTFASQFALGYTRFSLSAIPLNDGHNISDMLGVPGSDVGGGTGMVSLSISEFQGYGETNLPEIVPAEHLSAQRNAVLCLRYALAHLRSERSAQPVRIRPTGSAIRQLRLHRRLHQQSGEECRHRIRICRFSARASGELLEVLTAPGTTLRKLFGNRSFHSRLLAGLDPVDAHGRIPLGFVHAADGA